MSNIKQKPYEISQLLARISELEKLAYIGEHHFPDLTYKSRLEEVLQELNKARICNKCGATSVTNMEQLESLVWASVFAQAWELRKIPHGESFEEWTESAIKIADYAVLSLRKYKK